MKNGFWKGEVMVTLQELSEELKSYEVSIEIVTETLESIKESKAYKHIQTQHQLPHCLDTKIQKDHS